MAAIQGRNAQRPSRIWCAVVALASLLTLSGCGVREGELDAEQLPRNSNKNRPANSGGPGIAIASITGPSSGNQLLRETSPYLLAHSRDPVDWHPWNAETLELARRENKLIFVSVGYSSCHWCHLMARKVFADPAIARYLNEHFINVQIDREERPDLDELFLSALTLYYQAIGSPQTGGWPVSLFLTPDGKPLGGGTYFPPTDEPDRPGFPSVMQRVVSSWRDNHDQMLTNATLLERALQSTSRPRVSLKPITLERTLVDQILQRIRGSHDPQFGGFGFDAQNPDRAKFPLPTRLALLQFAVESDHDKASAEMLERTLDHMATGGLHDHLGGGFHRYCGDRRWRVPHFEKMLYDNALLIDIYTSAWEQTQKPTYREVAERAATFILRDLTDPQGAFYTALDADSEETEGKYYTWTPEQINAALPTADRPIFAAAFRINSPDGSENGPGVLEQVQTPLAVATSRRISERLAATRFTEIRNDLLAVRQRRTPPLRDEKIVTAWNGLAIHCLAHAGSSLGRPEYVEAAEKAASWILTRLRDNQGRLLHSSFRDHPHGTPFLDDYAFFVQGLLALHRATADSKWLDAARQLTNEQMQRFWDSDGKGCYFAPVEHEVWLTRSKHAFDGSLPAGNSVTARNLLRLSLATRDSVYRDKARDILELFSAQASESPDGMTTLGLALGEYLSLQQPGEPNGAASGADPGGAIAELTPRERARGNTPPPAAPAEPKPLPDALPEELPDLAEATPRTPRREAPRSTPAPKSSDKKKSPTKTPEVVAGEVYFSVDRLPAGQTSRAVVHLEIKKPWHINANPTGVTHLKPTVVTLKSSTNGITMQAKYPKGKEHPGAEGEEKSFIYSERASILAVLDVPATAAGQREELVFEVKYQACEGEQCLLPKTVQVKAVIDIAAEGESVKAINASIFQTRRK